MKVWKVSLTEVYLFLLQARYDVLIGSLNEPIQSKFLSLIIV